MSSKITLFASLVFITAILIYFGIVIFGINPTEELISNECPYYAGDFVKNYSTIYDHICYSSKYQCNYYCSGIKWVSIYFIMGICIFLACIVFILEIIKRTYKR